MSFIKTLWADMIYQHLYEDPQLKMLFNRDLESLARQGGNKITIPTLASGATVVRTDNLSVGSGLPLAIDDTEKDSNELFIYEYSTEPKVIRKLDVIQSNQNLLQKHTQEIAQIFKEHIFASAADHIIRNVQAGNKLTWNGASFASSDLADMEEALDNAKVLTNNRFALMKSTDSKSVLTENGMTAFFAQQQEAIKNGSLPTLFGLGLGKSTLIPNSKADGTIDDAVPANNTRRNVIAWRQQHMHLVIQTEIEITGGERAEYVGDVYTFTTRYGVKLERAEAAVQKTQQAA